MPLSTFMDKGRTRERGAPLVGTEGQQPTNGEVICPSVHAEAVARLCLGVISSLTRVEILALGWLLAPPLVALGFV